MQNDSNQVFKTNQSSLIAKWTDAAPTNNIEKMTSTFEEGLNYTIVDNSKQAL